MEAFLNLFRRFTCFKCNKQVKERDDLRGFSVNRDTKKQVELEYYDVCVRCGNKEVKNQKFKLRVAGALEMQIISVDLFNGWKNGIISQKDFIETLQDLEKKSRKEITQ